MIDSKEKYFWVKWSDALITNNLERYDGPKSDKLLGIAKDDLHNFVPGDVLPVFHDGRVFGHDEKIGP